MKKRLILFAALLPFAVAAQENPLLEPSDLPFGMPRFDRIKPAHFEEAFEKAAEQKRADAAKINDVPIADVTYENVVVPLLSAGSQFQSVNSLFSFMNGSMYSQDLREVEGEVVSLRNRFGRQVADNAGVIRRIEALYGKRETLDSAQKRTVEHLMPVTKKDVRAGADMVARIRIAGELNLLMQKFKSNISASDENFRFAVGSRDSLEGLPQQLMDMAASLAAREGSPDKWFFSEQSYRATMTYAENRDLRRRFCEARGNRCPQNKTLAIEIVNKRLEMARASGFPDYASMVISNNMARDPERVRRILASLLDKARPTALAEIRFVEGMARRDKGRRFEFQPWDWGYYYPRFLGTGNGARVDEAAKPYFSLDNTLKGALYCAGRLYGTKYKRRTDIPTWSPDVRVFELQDADGSSLGLLMADCFPRPGKNNTGGGWCSGFSPYPGPGIKPATMVTVNFNFTRQGESDNPQLSISDVHLVFHEIGHAMKEFFTRAIHPEARSSAPFDMEEFPSEMMECWAMYHETLKMFARHKDTGKPMPENVAAMIRGSDFYGPPKIPVWHLFNSLLDLEWHSITEPYAGTVEEFENAVAAKYDIPIVREELVTPDFMTSMAGGYGGQFYTYVWCRAMQADAWKVFNASGDAFDRKVAARFRRYILEEEDFEDPMRQYIEFRGSDPGDKLFEI